MEAFLTNRKKYNEGACVLDCGRWYDPSVTDWRDVLKEIGCMDEDGETVAEWFISDYDDCPLKYLGENPNLNTLEDLARTCDRYGADLVEAVYDLAGDEQRTIDIIECEDYTLMGGDVFDDDDLGHYLVDNGYFEEIPDSLVNYIDYEAIGRDYTINTSGEYVTINGSGYYLELL